MSGAREIEITLPGGRRVEARAGQHLIRTDQPVDNGGGDSAPTPFELFLASMGTCAGIFVQGFCASRGIPFDQIRIIERAEFDAAGVLAKVELELKLPEDFPARYREAVVKVVEQCSVKRAIAAQPVFNVHTG